MIQQLLTSGDCFGLPCSQNSRFVSGSLLYLGGVDGIYTLNSNRFDAVNNTAFFEAIVNQASAHSFYHAAQVNITKRMSHGLQIQGAYTWAHSIDRTAFDLPQGQMVDAGTFGLSTQTLTQPDGTTSALAVFSTSPPRSSQVLGIKLSR